MLVEAEAARLRQATEQAIQEAELATVKLLEWQRVRVHCLELGPSELTQSHGRSSMRAIAATEALEREERARRKNARIKTKKQGRPPALTENKRREALERLRGPVPATVTRVARAMKVSRATIYRALKLPPTAS